MKIVGVGCGPGLLTQEAISAIGSATRIYGSDRAIELARPYIPTGCSVKSFDDFKALHSLPQDAVVLSTGDPMLAGLGYLNGEVIPGISSLQIAASRLRIPLAQIIPVVAHGSGHEQGIRSTVDEVLHNKIVFLLADPKFDTDRLFNELRALKIPLNVAVCENLGYPDEQIKIGTVEAPPKVNASLYSILIGDF